MPVTQSAKKALRVSTRRRQINLKVIRAYREAIKEALKDSSRLGVAYSRLDRAVKKGVVHKNKAARLKSRLSKKIAREGKKAPPIKKTRQKNQAPPKKSRSAKSGNNQLRSRPPKPRKSDTRAKKKK